jgi:hypothetical protein
MSYLKLNLDREYIPTLVTQFCDNSILNSKISSKKVRAGQEEQYIINGTHEGEDKEIKISFISNQNGSTSINFKMGKFQSIGQQIADFICIRGVIDSRSNSISTLNAVKNEDFKFVIQNLAVDFNSLTLEEKKIPHGTQSIIQINTGEKIIFNYFETNTLTITGRPLLLHSSALNYFIELNYLKPIERFATSVQYYQIKTTFDKFEEELKARLPLAYAYLPDNIKTFILSAIILEKIEVDLPDYSCFAFNILKAIEGLMKHLLFEKEIIIDRAFDIFKKDIAPVKIRDNINIILGSSRSQIIEALYELYKKDRHTLFHTEYLDISTRIIEKREFAIDILNNSLNLINDSYQNLLFYEKF